MPQYMSFFCMPETYCCKELSEFAREYAEKYPEAYLDWIAILETEDNGDAVIQVAREGLSRIPQDSTVRAEVAETISTICSNDWLELLLTKVKHFFHS